MKIRTNFKLYRSFEKVIYRLHFIIEIVECEKNDYYF